MKAIRVNKGVISYDEHSLEVNDAQNDRSTIKVEYMGLCGSDLHKLKDPTFTQSTILGHELVGTVENGKTPGKKVIVSPLIGCGSCIYCKQGNIQLCNDISSIGRNLNGGFAEFVRAPSANILPVPEGLDPRLGVFVDGIAVVLHGLHLINAQILNNIKTVGIVGDGSIGILSAIMLHLLGKKVTVYCKHRTQLLQKIFGNIISFKEYNGTEENDMFELMIETVGGGQNGSINQCIQQVTKRGQILVFGVYPIDYCGEVILRNLFYKEATMIGSNSYGIFNGISEFQLALDYLYQYQDIYKKLIIDTLPLKEFEKGLQILHQNIKVIYTNP